MRQAALSVASRRVPRRRRARFDRLLTAGGLTSRHSRGPPPRAERAQESFFVRSSAVYISQFAYVRGNCTRGNRRDEPPPQGTFPFSISVKTGCLFHVAVRRRQNIDYRRLPAARREGFRVRSVPDADRPPARAIRSTRSSGTRRSAPRDTPPTLVSGKVYSDLRQIGGNGRQ